MSDASSLVFEPLGAGHDRAAFSCGVPSLDIYLRQQAGQDVRRNMALCYVLCETDAPTVIGYYTLSATSIEPTALPENEIRRLPRYPLLPAVLIGRLAVDSRYRGRRFGDLLLLDATQRTLRSGIAVFAFVVDALDEGAAAFYERFGFQQLPNIPLRLYLTAETLRRGRLPSGGTV